jgi:hypothetical protein
VSRRRDHAGPNVAVPIMTQADAARGNLPFSTSGQAHRQRRVILLGVTVKPGGVSSIPRPVFRPLALTPLTMEEPVVRLRVRESRPAASPKLPCRLQRQCKPQIAPMVAARRQPRKRPIMSTTSDAAISASRGTLTGDILWLATIAFVFAVITGMVG